MLRVGCGRRTLINRVLAPSPSFLLNFADLGSGQVSIVESASGTVGTFTRATTAWTKLSSGLWAPVSSGTPRYFYGGFSDVGGSGLGYLAEGARTNSCLQARDLTSGSWTKSNCTAAKDQVGIDGVNSSACSLLATGANATCLQGITLASAAKTFSIYLRRITGTGTINITLDNGSTWTDVTSQIASGNYFLVSATQTLANPTVGVRIVTSGDKIALDIMQNEDGACFASTPIPTTTGSVTRNADSLSYPTSGWFSSEVGTLTATLQRYTADTASARFFGSDSGVASANRLEGSTESGSFKFIFGDGTAIRSVLSTITPVANTTFKYVAAWSPSGGAISVSAEAPVSNATAPAIGTLSSMNIGAGHDGLAQFYGSISRVAYFPRRLSDGVLQQMTSQ